MNQERITPRTPPHSIEAERSVLGALMLDNRAWDRVVDIVTAEDFYRREHQLIFEAVRSLAKDNKPFDVLTISDVLKNQKNLEAAGGEVFLFELANNTPSAANAAAYAEIVRDRSILRKLLQTSTDISNFVFETRGNNTQELLNQAETKIFQISSQNQRGQGPVKLNTLLAKTIDRIDTLKRSGSSLIGVSSGFVDFDKLTSGLQPGDLIIVAARPSMGKTMFAVNIAEHVAIKEKKPVLIYSLEMPSEQITMRMFSSLGRIDQNKVRTGQLNEDDWARMSSAITMLEDANLYIDDTPALSPTELRSRTRRVAREQGQLGLIVVDYLQLMTVPGNTENRVVEISEISRSLKAIAKEMNVPLIALSQLNRSLEHRNDRRPVMSDLRESGSIEQDADVIAFIYRDEVYNEDSPDKGVAEIIIRKHRNGPIGDLRLTFHGQYTRFDNHTPHQISRSEAFI